MNATGKLTSICVKTTDKELTLTEIAKISVLTKVIASIAKAEISLVIEDPIIEDISTIADINADGMVDGIFVEDLRESAVQITEEEIAIIQAMRGTYRED